MQGMGPLYSVVSRSSGEADGRGLARAAGEQRRVPAGEGAAQARAELLVRGPRRLRDGPSRSP